MPSGDVHELGVAEAARRIREGRLSPVELLRACLERIRALDGTLRAWAHLDERGALAAAAEREAEARAGRLRGGLHGVPLGVKDIFHVAGMPTKAGAGPFAHTRPAADAPSVARLRAAGAIVLGKTATTQFAYRDPAPTRNPWKGGHTPGGSSAGSAAAVAARMVPLALGSQTVGSVLRPAAYCGVVGFKPPHGLVPAEGVIPLAWSLDHVGVFARSVDDVARALGPLVVGQIEPVAVETPRLALARELVERATPDVARHVEAVAQTFARAGAAIVEVKLPPAFGEIHAAGHAVMAAEAATYHEGEFRAHTAEYGPEIRALIEAGLAQPATAYVRAEGARRRFREAVTPILEAHDALLLPTAPGPAPEGLGSTGDASLCAPWSYAGVPAISLPSGLAPSGLPLAIQLVQAPDASARLLGVARWCEAVLAFSAAPAL